MQLQGRWRHNALHLFFNAARLPGPLGHPERGLGLGLVLQEGGLAVLVQVALVVKVELLVQVSI